MGAPDEFDLPGRFNGEDVVGDELVGTFANGFRVDHGFVENEFDFGFWYDRLIAQGETGCSQEREGEGEEKQQRFHGSVCLTFLLP